MKYMIREIPEMERPRERLVKYGAEALADYELLAIILRTGTKDETVLEVARNLTMQLNTLNDLNETTYLELQQIKGIGMAKALELLAVVELGKRIASPHKLNHIISSSFGAYSYLCKRMENLSQEKLVCLYLNTHNEVITEKIISMGTVDRTVFHPRDILKWALRYNAYAILIAHNHPSGDPNPSSMDMKMTKLMIDSSQIMGIVLVDHIIIGKTKYYSFVEKKIQNADKY